jgi:hypothetical protein
MLGFAPTIGRRVSAGWLRRNAVSRQTAKSKRLCWVGVRGQNALIFQKYRSGCLVDGEAQKKDDISLEFEREKWDAELRLREREIALKEREANRSPWWNPLIIAIYAATIAALGNAAVAWVSGIEQRGIENQKAEAARIVEVIKTNNVDKAAKNLQFLIDSGLISDPVLREKLVAFLQTRKPGQGPELPAPFPSPEVPSQGGGFVCLVERYVDAEQLARTVESVLSGSPLNMKVNLEAKDGSFRIMANSLGPSQILPGYYTMADVIVVVNNSKNSTIADGVFVLNISRQATTDISEFQSPNKDEKQRWSTAVVSRVRDHLLLTSQTSVTCEVQ